MALDEFEVATEGSGAPFARTASGERLPLAISISHSHEAAFCAVLPSPHPGGALGADLERLEPRSEPFVHDFFTASEAASWEEASPVERPLLANAIWSAKESVLKALGRGLTVDTRAVDIRLFDEPASGPVLPREGGWRRFDVTLEASLDDPGTSLAGFWRCHGPFVVTLASRTPSQGRKNHASH
jgi:phosphopantetheinyl transferase (holo-ACP synthase)